MYKRQILNNAADLEQYLSSGTIKGIITFSMVKDVLHSGGYLLVDEIENHFKDVYKRQLSGYGIHTIGELAATSDDFLKWRLGKNRCV